MNFRANFLQTQALRGALLRINGIFRGRSCRDLSIDASLGLCIVPVVRKMSPAVHPRGCAILASCTDVQERVRIHISGGAGDTLAHVYTGGRKLGMLVPRWLDKGEMATAAVFEVTIGISLTLRQHGTSIRTSERRLPHGAGQGEYVPGTAWRYYGGP